MRPSPGTAAARTERRRPCGLQVINCKEPTEGASWPRTTDEAGMQAQRRQHWRTPAAAASWRPAGRQPTSSGAAWPNTVSAATASRTAAPGMKRLAGSALVCPTRTSLSELRGFSLNTFGGSFHELCEAWACRYLHLQACAPPSIRQTMPPSLTRLYSQQKLQP